MIDRLEDLIFGNRPAVIGFFIVVTTAMLWSAVHLRIDAGFEKLLPLNHPYMKTFVKHRAEFGGANRVLVALMARDGDIFTPEYFDILRQATDEVFFIPGVERTRVTSLFTPNVRFTEVIEGGIAGGNVIPADFQPTQQGLEKVRANILKAGIKGRLVANDFTGAMISAELLEFDPVSGDKLDFVVVAQEFEEKLRGQFGDRVDVHIIGFAKAIGDITNGARKAVLFFAIAFLITVFVLYGYSLSAPIVAAVLSCSIMAVVWQLGLLPVLGFGLDPMSILVPFLIFSIGVSHGVQMVSALRAELFLGGNAEQAARRSFRRLAIPGTIALVSDTIGFITILLIDIGIIREMAITASLGVAIIILTNLVLLPVLLSYLRSLEHGYQERLERIAARLMPIWSILGLMATRKKAVITLLIAAVLFGVGFWKGNDVSIGDLHAGVPELRPDSRYNYDTQIITDKFSIGVDIMTVFVETVSEGCINYEVMAAVDNYAWHMQNVKGVQSVISLPQIAKLINSGWNEGSLKWQVLPRNTQALVQSTSPVDTSSGLLNKDCSVMPVLLFTTDHKATTIERIIKESKQYQDLHGNPMLKFSLAGSNVGVMAATNEAVKDAQFRILVYVFAAIIVLVWFLFRSLVSVICIVAPLALVSLLAYALMALLDIGLKVNTLPVVALGVGIGVDYGIYIYSRFQDRLKKGEGIAQGYRITLAFTGFGVLITACTLAAGVATWIFSPLQFQADMGILLTFIFLMNMLGAVLLLPAIAAWLLRKQYPA